MERICVFCGSSPGARPAYRRAAKQMGQALADRGITLVYGGGSVGMMGYVAQAIIEAGGDVIGVIPRAILEMEVAFTDLSDLRVVGSMHERKALMAELADGFIALPGGLGTLEEFFEVLTWAQLGIHHKPCGFLNVDGYYDRLVDFLDHMVEQRFVESVHRGMVLMDQDPERLLRLFETYQPAAVDKAAWILALKAETV
ncbi:MAG TPA: TIGR00730 family Rossman fold protein [Chloroflexi bacterium]|nr:TIGR00730 family Rossman fold protein [Chloroflexota bacterium]